ncbi:hypothetical protein [Kocuria sabuli]|uniref:hypothetical protein n=1 Tax=Kocuria sabuli TaxID=3071448 RepID=UPI0034D64499
MVAFEVFDKRMTPLAKAPAVKIQKRGVISLNRAAHELIDSPETVELLFDAQRSVMALRPADDTSPHAYGVRTGSTKGPGQAMVSATAFTQHYGIDTTVTRRWRPFVEDGMLCIDLTQTGTVIEGNRAKNRTPSTPDAGTDPHASDATPSATQDADTSPDAEDTAAAEED